MTQAEVIILYSYKCLKFMSMEYLNLREAPMFGRRGEIILPSKGGDIYVPLTLNLCIDPWAAQWLDRSVGYEEEASQEDSGETDQAVGCRPSSWVSCRDAAATNPGRPTEGDPRAARRLLREPG